MSSNRKFSKPHLSRVVNGDIERAAEPETEKVQKKRLDAWISENHETINRSQAERLIKDGRVRVNGTPATKTSSPVGPDDNVEVELPEPAPKQPVEIPIIYEDDDVIVIDKPAGILSHVKGNSCSEYTVADLFKSKSQFAETDDTEGRTGNSSRQGVVHRLDRDTSGVMIGAKNEAARAKLQAQFSQRKAKKTYYAVVEGHLKNDQAVINLPIRRNAKRPTTFLVEAGGREAITNYQVKEFNNKYSLIELKPQTGRTHQLRVHLAHLGHPIVGDRVYGKPADRLYLHAAELEITLPDGERKTFSSKLPKGFKELVE